MSMPSADNWDGPYFRPFMCDEFRQYEWAPEQSLALNALDLEGCWHYTVSGFGGYRCGSQKQVLGAGQVFAYRSPDRGRLCHDKRGLPWHTLCIHVRGQAAMEMFDYIIGRFGMFHELPKDCSAVKLARKLVRTVAAQPHRNAHYWSKLTFEWLDAWWECAEKHSALLSDVLREPPHSSRLLSYRGGNVKNMAEQLGYSRFLFSPGKPAPLQGGANPAGNNFIVP